MSISEKEVFKNIGFLIQEDGRVSLDRESFNHLIIQAKRAQELENVLEQDARQGVLEGLYEQNQHYRKALEYYAAPITWVPDETGVSDADKYTNTVAREALEGIE